MGYRKREYLAQHTNSIILSIVKSQQPFKKGPVIINLELAKRNTASNQTGPMTDLIVPHWQGAVWRSRIMHSVFSMNKRRSVGKHS